MKPRLWIILGVLAALAIPAGLILVPRFTDIDPIDDSDLTLPPREVNSAENPLPEIRAFSVPSEMREKFRRAAEMKRGELAADVAFVDALLESQAENLERFETIAKLTGWQETRPLRLDADMDYLTSWLQLARFKARVEIVHLAESGQADRAIDSALSILQFAQQLQQAEGGLIHQLSAMAIATDGVHAVLHLIDLGGLPSASLDRIAEAVSALTFSPEAFTEVYKVEYETFSRVVDDLADGRIEITQLAREIETGRAPKNFSFKRNRTRKLMADAYRQFIAEALMIRADAPLENTAVFDKVQSSPGTMNISGNRIGWILFCVTVPAGDEVNNRHAIFQATMDLFRVRIALERYRQATGDWPDDLGALVPDYLAAIPADVMDGKPLRYRKSAGVLYSVGTNFTDEKGFPGDSPANLGDAEEIVIHFGDAHQAAGSPTP